MPDVLMNRGLKWLQVELLNLPTHVGMTQQ